VEEVPQAGAGEKHDEDGGVGRKGHDWEKDDPEPSTARKSLSKSIIQGVLYENEAIKTYSSCMLDDSRTNSMLSTSCGAGGNYDDQLMGGRGEMATHKFGGHTQKSNGDG